MAIYHLSSQIIGRSGGKSSVASAAYRSGEKIQDEHIGQTFDYTKKMGVDYKEILAPDHSPAWVQDRGQLWNQVELAERRKDAQLARELNIALPKELSKEQQIELIRSFTKEKFVDKGMVADITMHHLDGENPHAHVMLTTREIGPEGFGKKNREWNDRELLKDWRKEWAERTNQALEKADISERIDHRSLKDQGIKNRLPQKHIGVHASAMEKRGIQTERGNQNRLILEINADLKSYDQDNAVYKQAEKQYQKAKSEADIHASKPTPVQPQPKPLGPEEKEVSNEINTRDRNKAHEKPTPPIHEQTQPTTSFNQSFDEIIKGMETDGNTQSKALEPMEKEVGNGRNTLSVDDWKKEILQAKQVTVQPQQQPQEKTYQEIRADFDQARIEFGRQQEAIDRLDSQLRSETFKLQKFDNYEKRIGEVEERLGKLSSFKPWQWNEKKALEQSKARLIKDKQADFGETERGHIVQRITQLHSEKRSKEKKLPDLEKRYKETKGTYDQRSAEIKAMNRQRDFVKSKDLLERYQTGENISDKDKQLINSFSKELNIKKIRIESLDRAR
ncbi:MobA/MobL family protein (plasmid) [Desulfosporosinus acidiphilus SJ4]|uniref:MobA/MobL family protein n=1 Tax=Desulfosporosinus acidiphilus (strain DSM 22704 / JCM 16185 / SJ4) TaxID=646529 RepID=I4DCV2_DESAJ|nr:MobQ family relaxase [Desulfosporosinus acidiphilus]AFM43626.1 MobA/MobL family protein [Desulfosporosinus acidiphilus SJ4]